jgi:hypothetical protein
MIAKSKATKVVDDWYKKREMCSSLSPSDRVKECEKCEFNLLIHNYLLNDSLIALSTCDMFTKVFNG